MESNDINAENNQKFEYYDSSIDMEYGQFADLVRSGKLAECKRNVPEPEPVPHYDSEDEICNCEFEFIHQYEHGPLKGGRKWSREELVKAGYPPDYQDDDKSVRGNGNTSKSVCSIKETENIVQKNVESNVHVDENIRGNKYDEKYNVLTGDASASDDKRPKVIAEYTGPTHSSLNEKENPENNNTPKQKEFQGGNGFLFKRYYTETTPENIQVKHLDPRASKDENLSDARTPPALPKAKKIKKVPLSGLWSRTYIEKPREDEFKRYLEWFRTSRKQRFGDKTSCISDYFRNNDDTNRFNEYGDVKSGNEVDLFTRDESSDKLTYFFPQKGKICMNPEFNKNLKDPEYCEKLSLYLFKNGIKCLISKFNKKYKKVGDHYEEEVEETPAVVRSPEDEESLNNMSKALISTVRDYNRNRGIDLLLEGWTPRRTPESVYNKKVKKRFGRKARTYVAPRDKQDKNNLESCSNGIFFENTYDMMTAFYRKCDEIIEIARTTQEAVDRIMKVRIFCEHFCILPEDRIIFTDEKRPIGHTPNKFGNFNEPDWKLFNIKTEGFIRKLFQEKMILIRREDDIRIARWRKNGAYYSTMYEALKIHECLCVLIRFLRKNIDFFNAEDMQVLIRFSDEMDRLIYKNINYINEPPGYRCFGVKEDSDELCLQRINHVRSVYKDVKVKLDQVKAFTW